MSFHPKSSTPGRAVAVCCTDSQDGEAPNRNQVLRAASAGTHRARHGNHAFRQGTPDCAKFPHLTAPESWGRACSEAISPLRLPPDGSKVRSSTMLFG